MSSNTNVKCTTQTSSNDCSYPNCACGEPPKNKANCGSSTCSCAAGSCTCKPGECKY